ncbi:hypothetical protein Acsp02_81370 [Actinoplanes sp. NBRC 103695]|nr:hypothetical protein Acsp02_81370 [Actinoplanes sp. NBRC 103695]
MKVALNWEVNLSAWAQIALVSLASPASPFAPGATLGAALTAADAPGAGMVAGAAEEDPPPELEHAARDEIRSRGTRRRIGRE